ncbi:MAG: ATP-grasp domain-containing protein [Candidatus Obscuribacterales bacterium]|nr:ATP-grasp domain-containing protein [Candidatus Obscuribacterales bacterium]
MPRQSRRIGILGGGQLGLMLSESIGNLGGEAIVYDPDPEAPAVKHVRQSFNFPFSDHAAIARFFESVDVVTYEFENVEVEPLKPLEGLKPIYPAIRVLEICQDRIKEKRFLESADLPHARYLSAATIEEMEEKIDDAFFPSVLKTARGGYDGKGQFFCADKRDLEGYLQQLKPARGDDLSVELESFIDIEMEASCIVACPITGEPIVFPVFENIHQDHILDLTILPARLPESVTDKLKELALIAADRLDVVGLLTSEFFLSKKPPIHDNSTECDGWNIYINEFAPRPHNSGHITRNACHMSQFQALARILMEIPLGSPSLAATLINDKVFCMANLLGDTWLNKGAEEAEPHLELEAIGDNPHLLEIFLYGKNQARSKRKMGHFVTMADSAELAIEAARSFKKRLAGSKISKL